MKKNILIDNSHFHDPLFSAPNPSNACWGFNIPRRVQGQIQEFKQVGSLSFQHPPTPHKRKCASIGWGNNSAPDPCIRPWERWPVASSHVFDLLPAKDLPEPGHSNILLPLRINNPGKAENNTNWPTNPVQFQTNMEYLDHCPYFITQLGELVGHNVH